MKKVIVFVVMMPIILSTFISCNFSSTSITLGNNFSNINLLCGACDDENHVYYINADKKVMRISKETGKITDMGVSTDFLGTLSIVDGYLYLNAADYDSGGCCVTITPCKINLSRIKEITYFDYETTGIGSAGDPVIKIGETIYFGDGSGGTAIGDIYYQILGAENNAIYAFIKEDGETETIIENGLHQRMTWVYKLSTDWKTEQKLFQFCYESGYPLEEGSFHGISIFNIIFGGYMYSIMPNKYDPDRYGFYDFQLYRNKLSKNSEKEVLYEFGNNYARILAITDDGVYFYITEAETHKLSNIHKVNPHGF